VFLRQAASSSCPDRINCIACRQFFTVGTIRQILIDNRSLVQGDLCSACARLRTTEIQRLLTNSGLERMLSDVTVDQERGQELLTVAQENLQQPSLWQWLIKKIEIFATETNALEQARFKITPEKINCRRLQNLEYLYQGKKTR
jgi:hypothetical protein